MSFIAGPPIVNDKSITDMVCPRMCAMPLICELDFGITVKLGHCRTSRTLKTLIPTMPIAYCVRYAINLEKMTSPLMQQS